MPVYSEYRKNAHNQTIEKNKDMYELVRYVNREFPIKAELHYLSMFFLNSFECHWHNEIEILIVRNGKMRCFVDDNEILLREGMGIVISSNRLHHAKSLEEEDCEYIVIMAEPEFLAEKESLIYRKYVEPVVYNPRISYTLFDRKNNEAAVAAAEKLLLDMNEKKAGFELDSMIDILTLWREILRCTPAETEDDFAQIGYVKKMLAYIHTHYNNDISVKDLADYVNLSYAETCRIFKKSICQTIVNYIQIYRIKKSIPMLQNREMNISQIAMQVGFNGASYYSEIFRKVTGKTPNAYRREL